MMLVVPFPPASSSPAAVITSSSASYGVCIPSFASLIAPQGTHVSWADVPRIRSDLRHVILTWKTSLRSRSRQPLVRNLYAPRIRPARLCYISLKPASAGKLAGPCTSSLLQHVLALPIRRRASLERFGRLPTVQSVRIAMASTSSPGCGCFLSLNDQHDLAVGWRSVRI